MTRPSGRRGPRRSYAGPGGGGSGTTRSAGRSQTRLQNACWTTLDELDEAALISILVDPRNALTKQYRKLFEMEGCDLEFRDDALRAIATRAMHRKTGAGGLRTILESVLLDTMYELPSMTNARKVVVRRGRDPWRDQALRHLRV